MIVKVDTSDDVVWVGCFNDKAYRLVRVAVANPAGVRQYNMSLQELESVTTGEEFWEPSSMARLTEAQKQVVLFASHQAIAAKALEEMFRGKLGELVAFKNAQTKTE